MPNFADIGLRARALNQHGLPEIGYSVPLADVQLTPAGPLDYSAARMDYQAARAGDAQGASISCVHDAKVRFIDDTCQRVGA